MDVFAQANLSHILSSEEGWPGDFIRNLVLGLYFRIDARDCTLYGAAALRPRVPNVGRSLHHFRVPLGC